MPCTEANNLLILGEIFGDPENPTQLNSMQPNPTQPNPTQPNPSRQGMHTPLPQANKAENHTTCATNQESLNTAHKTLGFHRIPTNGGRSNEVPKQHRPARHEANLEKKPCNRQRELGTTKELLRCVHIVHALWQLLATEHWRTI